MSHVQSISHSADFEAPVSRVWNLLIDWQGIVDWMPDGYIRSLEIEGTGKGAIRHLVTGKGVAISERLDDADEDRGILQLSIIEPMPWGMLSYTARARLTDSGPNRCHLEWCGTFSLPKSGPESDQLAVLLKKSYIKMFTGISNQVMGGNRHE